MSFGIKNDGSYLVSREGTTYGPYRGDALPAMYAAHQVLPTDMIAQAGANEWITVAQAIAFNNASSAPDASPVIATAPPASSSNGLAVAGFVLGVLSLLLTVTGGACVAVFIAPVGLALCLFGLFHANRGLAVAGIILNAITVVLSILAALGIALCCAASL
ncbi:MAG: hypothetical protein EXS10_08590 [Phycisphaerales bacterium]|nr:hypothetical protein [Phycisphaerales bacterium]